ncbi:non-homologous end-joining DNA ligase [Winogradskyella aurantia]|uniref:ATP-dependent DNA ligase n=1 Tax=Winogradskyella aurantia TaxID=1915063 RepID=A0A265UWW0_9FLAO|nr:non-homologous end-joining DNA ligase [Winogradskyella aurantia]OZV69798.1 ATP-dependent DNA ligase [Winogradskyella aurantia]
MNLSLNKSRQTHKDKILFPVSGITKQNVLEYYYTISDYILPYLKDRPLTMQRFPNGIDKEGFFQKHIPDYFPDWIPTVKVKKQGGSVNHVLCNSKDVLSYLVSQYALTFHVTLSRIDKIEYPDKLIFDLDPPKDDFKLAIKAAKAVRNLLENELELKAFLMTTGSRGLHIAVPLKADESFDTMHEFSRLVSHYICSNSPNEFTTAVRKDKRKGRLFIDYIRNSYGQTSVAPFSIRAIENAPVATLLSWDELDNRALTAQTYTIDNIVDRLEKKTNPWEDFEQNAKSTDSAMHKIKKMT